MRNRVLRILLALVLMGAIFAAVICAANADPRQGGSAAAATPSLSAQFETDDLSVPGEQSLSAAFVTPPPKPEGPPQLDTDEHRVYLSADEDGLIHPDQTVTRGETAQILYSLMLNPVEGKCDFADIPEDHPLRPALECLICWDVISYGTGDFRPDDPITRAELVTMLEAFYPADESAGTSFSDMEGHWAAAAAENALTRGWIDASENFDPSGSIRRDEFCRLMNRAMGRCCDSAAVILSEDYPAPFRDLGPTSLYYEDMMEAACAHEFQMENGAECWTLSQSLPTGLHHSYGRLYCVDENGTVLRSTNYEEVWDFAADGRYTTGVTALDELITEILCQIIQPYMEGDEDLREAYLYVKRDHEYARIPWTLYNCPEDSLEYQYRALRFLPGDSGCCYDYACAFGYLARALGYKAYIVYGEINENYEAHGWVIIPEDGVDYMYDPEMEDVRDWRHFDFDLFRLQNGWRPYMYWYEPWWGQEETADAET